MPTSTTSLKANPPRKGRAKASNSATPVEPKPKPKRKSSGGCKPGAKAWNCAKFLRFLCLIAELCPSIACNWIPLAKRHSAEQETDQIKKACQDKWGFVLKVKKPTGGRTLHLLYILAHAVNDHLNKVHRTATLNNKPSELEAELKGSIAHAFEVAKALLRGLKDMIPAFDKDFKPLEQPDEEVKEEGKEVEAAKDGEEHDEDHGDGVELFPGAEYQGKDVEEFGPGKAPNGVERKSLFSALN